MARFRISTLATLVLIPLAVSVAIPAVAAAAASGGWNPLGQGATAGSQAFNDKVQTLTKAGSRLFVGGDFTNVGGLAAGDHVGIWDGTAWSAVGGGINDGAVYAIAVDGTKTFVGGSFTNASGNANADRAAFWNGSAWQPMGGGGINGPVFAMAIVGRTLYVGGGFDNVNGNAVADGIVGYHLDTDTWFAVTDENGDIGGTVSSIVADGSGGIYVGGSFINADEIATADFVAHYNGAGAWSALGSSAINDRVRGLAASGSDLYAVGDFTNAGGDTNADKVARWNGSSWVALGASFFGESPVVSLYGVAVDGSNVYVDGGFINANGNALADGIAGFVGGTWKNVGTSASGTNGPASGRMVTIAVVGARLYAGGLDTAIGGGTQNSGAAFFRLRQPDGTIATTGAPAGNDIYNTTGKQQAKSLTVHRTDTGTFTIKFFNDGNAAGAMTVKGTGSTGAFTVTYMDGATDVTAQVVAGTFAINNLAPGASKTLTLKVKVKSSASVGSSKVVVVTATSTGGGTPKDAVKATTKAS